MLEELNKLEENSIDAIVTDPPYELNFMNKGWDNSGISFQKETWEKCLRVLKPGGYLLAFGGSRTFHRIACAIEDAGFEIRDTIMYLFGSGFPKSMNIGLEVDKKMVLIIEQETFLREFVNIAEILLVVVFLVLCMRKELQTISGQVLAHLSSLRLNQ